MVCLWFDFFFSPADSIDEALLHTLSRDDLRDLFPGPENFLRRKQLWAVISREVSLCTLIILFYCTIFCVRLQQGNLPCNNCALIFFCGWECHFSWPGWNRNGVIISRITSIAPHIHSCGEENPRENPAASYSSRICELELARKQHFELACTGREGESVMSKELRCRLVRNTVTSMISILRASHQGEELRYPSKHEVTAMAKRLVEYYPMLQDKDAPIKHE